MTAYFAFAASCLDAAAWLDKVAGGASEVLSAATVSGTKVESIRPKYPDVGRRLALYPYACLSLVSPSALNG